MPCIAQVPRCRFEVIGEGGGVVVWQKRDAGGVVTLMVLVLRQGSTDEGLGARQNGQTPLDFAIGLGFDAVAPLLREVRWS